MAWAIVFASLGTWLVEAFDHVWIWYGDRSWAWARREWAATFGRVWPGVAIGAAAVCALLLLATRRSIQFSDAASTRVLMLAGVPLALPSLPLSLAGVYDALPGQLEQHRWVSDVVALAGAGVLLWMVGIAVWASRTVTSAPDAEA